MKLISNLSAIDYRAIHEFDIPGLLLMEEAGRHVAQKVLKIIACKNKHSPNVVIICGPGNNGGDGFVCARHLAMGDACNITVIQTVLPGNMPEDACINGNMLDCNKISLVKAPFPDNLEVTIQQADIIVDALFGSGLTRCIEGIYLDLINMINKSDAVKVAVDLPSGINSANGEVMGVAVKADFTVTFAAPKPGLFFFPGKNCSGEVTTVDIGIPACLIDAEPGRTFLVTSETAKECLPKRHKQSNKYSYGSVLVVAGSRDMPGAAVMSAEAALKTGAGLVFLAAPKSALESMSLAPEIIRIELPETEQGTLNMESLEIIKKGWRNYTSVVTGPGITTSCETVKFVENFMLFLKEEFKGGVVVDADALNCISMLSSPIKLLPRFIMTPHLGECSRLIGKDKAEIERNLVDSAEKASNYYNTTVILKSASSIIYGDNQCWINSTGNPGMATAGSGDVLTGIISGLLAQGGSTIDACIAGVYMHGLAGDFASEDLTPYCMVATDIVKYLPEAIKKILKV